MATDIPPTFSKIKPYLVDKISPLLDARVVQILLLRQTHDYTIFRTEESRELNTVVIPDNITSVNPVVKVAFLASKQKAPESRMFSRFLRTMSKITCQLKDGLCMKCPRCVLFGAVNTSGKAKYNIKHRIEYSTAFSVEKYDDLLESITFNAITESSQLTGQALNVTHNVRPLANFPSVVTLSSVTWQELALYLKTVLATKSYGAETRIKGDMRNVVLGLVAGYEEVITSLEYALELAAIWESEDLAAETEKILKKYVQLSASRKNIIVLSTKELNDLVSSVQDLAITETFVKSMEKQADDFVKLAAKEVNSKK